MSHGLELPWASFALMMRRLVRKVLRSPTGATTQAVGPPELLSRSVESRQGRGMSFTGRPASVVLHHEDGLGVTDDLLAQAASQMGMPSLAVKKKKSARCSAPSPL